PDTTCGNGSALVQVVERPGAVCKVKADKALVQDMTTFVSIRAIERTTGSVVIERLQPPDIAPSSGLASSITKRLQFPFGLEPLKMLKEASPGDGGAGGGNANWKLERRFVGLKVPD